MQNDKVTIEDVKVSLGTVGNVLLELAQGETNYSVRLALQAAHRHIGHANTYLLTAAVQKAEEELRGKP